MQVGFRTKVPLPRNYKGFRVVLSHGRYYGIPRSLKPLDYYNPGMPILHPAILSTATKEELFARIDALATRPDRPELLGQYEGYNLVRHRGSVYGMPQAARRLDLDEEDDRRRAGVIGGRTLEEVQERIRGLRGRVPIEFAGWLPVYEVAGNCGKHPQFTHTAEPPPGYHFTCSAPRRRRGRSLWNRGLGLLGTGLRQVARSLWLPVRPLFGIVRGSGFAPRARIRVLGAIFRLFFTLLFRGTRLLPVLRFLRSRHYQSQVLLGRSRDLVFLTSMPNTYGQNPWVVEIEDPTTLFFPFVHNGQTSDLDMARLPYLPIIKTLLESDQCKGILTHMKSTAELVPTLFGSETVRAKVHYTPLGVKLPQRWQRHQATEAGEPLNLLFINSWCQHPGNFFVRGGLDILEAFAILRERYPQLRLTLRTELPPLDVHYHRIMETGWVRVIDRFLPAEEMDALMAESHIFLLPAARVHIVSLLQAMSYGLAVVTSDGWGIQEYVNHERNGLIVKGRYGKVSWADEKAGLLRENYEPMYTPDPEVIPGLVEAVSRLVEDRALRRRLGRTARRDVETTYNLEQWNQGLKEAFDKALSRAPGPCPVESARECLARLS
jgi:glycosyltransferase involved in cell wall biosynthesis